MSVGFTTKCLLYIPTGCWKDEVWALWPNPKKNMVYGTCAGVDYNLTLCLLQHIYHGQPYARVDFIPQSGTLDLAFKHWVSPYF